MTDAGIYHELGEQAWSWVQGQLRGDDGPWLPENFGEQAPNDDRDTFYAGIAGLAPALAEISLCRELTEAERALQKAIAQRLVAQVPTRQEACLYTGLAGDATALKILAPGQEQIALRRLAELQTPEGWPTTVDFGSGFRGAISDVVLGTAGVVMTAVWAGGPHAKDIAIAGSEALLKVARPMGAGLEWRLHPEYPSSSPNFSHGTAGVAAALALTGLTYGRADLVEAARQGAESLVSLAHQLDEGGFVVPHTIPDSTRDVEPLTYTWCHGPTGTSYLFSALELAGAERAGGFTMRELRQRCVHSVLTSGLPERLRPGFWDNDGRCCGTAGVGDMLLDAYQDGMGDELLPQAQRMADALLQRAIRDETGACWRFIEHRNDEPLLPPGTSWMQGAAGVATFLLRLARVLREGPEARVVTRPDQWWGVPARLARVSI
ncbi:lanthionine synthetase LanC family protein [Catelliglobosispora koreensis]|uniref:lanthionine synthetase LanC family protein n=1 Tax=Catelliglobosispora koreensis TaxID=129052 RepID=UPI00036AE1D5|nr:lanthionine synthetase LanC family protein [Catelliglobosispora koreensis]